MIKTNRYLILFGSFFLILLCRTFLTAQDQQKESGQNGVENIERYLSAAYLDSADCAAYRAGEAAHKQAYNSLFSGGTESLGLIMAALETEENLSETQREWLLSLAEDICRRNPQAADFLIATYPSAYDLIAACRTEAAISHLADEADALSGPSGIELLLVLFGESEGKGELDDQEKNDLRLLLTYLAVDGENITALKALKKGYDDGLFFAASRMMDVYNKPGADKPFLTASYVEKIEDILKDDEDSNIFGMTIGLDQSFDKIKQVLLGLQFGKIPEAKIEKYCLLFLWYLELNLDKGILDNEVMKKYADFMGLYNVDSLAARKALCSSAGKNGLTAEKICSFIKDNPKYKTIDPAEKCLYPELELCQAQTENGKGE